MRGGMAVGAEHAHSAGDAMTMTTSSSPAPLSSSSSYSSLDPAKAQHIAIAASFASILTKFLTYPLDTLKSRVQNYSTALKAPLSSSSSSGAQSLRRGGGALWHLQRGSFHPRRGLFYPSSCRVAGHFARRTGAWGSLGALCRGRAGALWEEKCFFWQGVRVAYEGRWGLRDLYGGFLLKSTLYVPYQICYQNAYNAATGLLHISDYRPTNFHHHKSEASEDYSHADEKARMFSFLWRVAACAVAAEFASLTFRIPIETMKLRIQTKAAQNATDAIHQLFKNGFRAAGRHVFSQTVVHDMPYSIIQWVTYETLRTWALSPPASSLSPSRSAPGCSSPAGDTGGDRPGKAAEGYAGPFLRLFLSGGASGLVAATVTIPLDNIRTRVTVATARAPSLRMWDVVANAYRTDGIRALFRGGAMRTLYVSANMAIYFPIFELSKRLLAQ